VGTIDLQKIFHMGASGERPYCTGGRCTANSSWRHGEGTGGRCTAYFGIK